MRVEALNSVSLPKLFEVPCRRLRVHGISGAVLREYPLTDAGGRLFIPEPTEKADSVLADIDATRFAIFRRGDINALLWCVLQISPDRDSSRRPSDIAQLEAAQLSTARATVCG